MFGIVNALYAVKALDHLVVVGGEAEVLRGIEILNIARLYMFIFLFGNRNQVSNDVRVLIEYKRRL